MKARKSKASHPDAHRSQAIPLQDV
uniref:Uncharacterized protein n=1 Tax=Anguilla anguilla TaxID=7936 RepID=A0A0E9TI36_ANGAN